MINVQLLGAALLVSVAAYPSAPDATAPERTTTTSRTVRLGPVEFPVVRDPTADEIDFRCETAEDHGACERKCRSLRPEYDGGRCVEKVCRCRLAEETPATVEARGHPTVECESLLAVGDDAERRRACKSQCRQLRKEYADGSCVDGVCHCREGIRTGEGNPPRS